MSGAMTLSSDSMAELNLDDHQPGYEMGPWVTVGSLGSAGLYAIVEQSSTVGWLAIAVGVASACYEKYNRQREKRERMEAVRKEREEQNEIGKLRDQVATISSKLDTILLVESRIPRGDGADTDA